MKHSEYLYLVSIIMASSCTNMNKNVEHALAQRDSIIQEYNSQKDEFEKLSNVMDAIYTTVDSITEQENAIYFIKENGAPNKRKELIEQLKFLGQLIDRQRQSIKDLKDSLNADSLNSPKSRIKLTKIISFLEKQLEEKDQTISRLKSEIAQKNKDISKLNIAVSELKTNLEDMNEKNDKQSKALDIQDNILNEGYVLIATKKELKDMGIITSNIFKTKINPTAFNSNIFKKIDLRDFKEINIKGKKIKILTHVPQSAYIIQEHNGGVKLTVTDPSLFWSVSNYLVIQVSK